MVIDSLSIKYKDVMALLCALLIIQSNCIIEGKEEWNNDPSMWTLIKQEKKDSNVLETFV